MAGNKCLPFSFFQFQIPFLLISFSLFFSYKLVLGRKSKELDSN